MLFECTVIVKQNKLVIKQYKVSPFIVEFKMCMTRNGHERRGPMLCEFGVK